MKVSEIGTQEMCSYLRIDMDYISADDAGFLDAAYAGAVQYVIAYTGLSADDIDDHEDLTIAVLVLVSDMFDNRQMTVEKRNANRVVDSILGMHCTNLLG